MLNLVISPGMQRISWVIGKGDTFYKKGLIHAPRNIVGSKRIFYLADSFNVVIDSIYKAYYSDIQNIAITNLTVSKSSSAFIVVSELRGIIRYKLYKNFLRKPLDITTESIVKIHNIANANTTKQRDKMVYDAIRNMGYSVEKVEEAYAITGLMVLERKED